MRARFMSPGMPFKYDGHTMIFIARLRRGHEIAGPTINVVQCDDYRGLDGPRDLGIVHISDRDIAKKSSPTTVQELRTAKAKFPALIAELNSYNSAASVTSCSK
jgi:hypothetical protein